MNPHDLVTSTLACMAAPVGAMSMTGSMMGSSQSMATSSSAAACGTVASEANVSPQALRIGDTTALQTVRDHVEQGAKGANLSDDTKNQLLTLYDRGTAAARESNAAMQVAVRYMLGTSQVSGMGGGPTGTTSAAPPPPRPTSRRAQMNAVPRITPAEADALRAHDKLRDLSQFAHSTSAGPMANEADALAWLLSAERFMQTPQLPTRLKVLAAEPLFDTQLGVPTPSAAQGEVAKIPNSLWSQYLDSGAKAVRESGATSMQAPGGGYGGGPTGSSTGGATTGATSPTNHAGTRNRSSQKDLANWREVTSYVEQRMDAVAQRIPPSDLRQALNSYADEIRTEAIGGGPGRPPSGGQMQMPPSGGGMTAPPSGGTQMAPPSGGTQMAPPSGTPRTTPPPSGTTPGHGGTAPGAPGTAPTPGGTAPAPGGAPTVPEMPSTPPEGTNPSYP
jgi:hypothetical protein